MGSESDGGRSRCRLSKTIVDGQTDDPLFVGHYPQKTPTEPPPADLAEIHIIGIKYIDYFTDGSTTIAVPGDQNIDSNLDKPDAPIPTHAGMTWVHTIGENLYDTPSGDLEVGDYALQPDGSYIQHSPPFVSSTSTPDQLATSPMTGTETDSSTTSSRHVPYT